MKKKISRIFASHRLVHNNRKIVKIVVSKECNGAFAVVDVDTSWQRISDGNTFISMDVYIRYIRK